MFERSNSNTKDGYRWQPSCFAVCFVHLSQFHQSQPYIKLCNMMNLRFFGENHKNLLTFTKNFRNVLSPAQKLSVRTIHKSSVPGPFAKASAAQPAPLARLIFYFMDRALRSYRAEHAALYASVHAVCSARYG